MTTQKLHSVPTKKQRYYKPLATKTPVLLFFLLASLICIALLEVVLHQAIPLSSPQNTYGSRRLRLRALAPRQTYTAATSTPYNSSVAGTGVLDSSTPTANASESSAAPTSEASAENTSGINSTTSQFISTTTSQFNSTTTSPFIATTTSQFNSTTTSPFLSTTTSRFNSTTTSPFIPTTTSQFNSTTTSPFISTTTSPFLSTTTSQFNSTTTSSFLSTTTSRFNSTTTSPFLSTTTSRFNSTSTNQFTPATTSQFNSTTTSQFSPTTTSQVERTTTSQANVTTTTSLSILTTSSQLSLVTTSRSVLSTGTVSNSTTTSPNSVPTIAVVATVRTTSLTTTKSTTAIPTTTTATPSTTVPITTTPVTTTTILHTVSTTAPITITTSPARLLATSSSASLLAITNPVTSTSLKISSLTTSGTKLSTSSNPTSPAPRAGTATTAVPSTVFSSLATPHSVSASNTAIASSANTGSTGGANPTSTSLGETISVSASSVPITGPSISASKSGSTPTAGTTLSTGRISNAITLSSSNTVSSTKLNQISNTISTNLGSFTPTGTSFSGTLVTSSNTNSDPKQTLITSSEPLSTFIVVHRPGDVSSSIGTEPAVLALTASASKQFAKTAALSKSRSPSPSATAEASTNDNSVELRLPGPVTQVDYFSGLYLCLIVAVLFKSAWGIVFAASKMMEPFYQLSKEGGASAQESLVSDYLSSGLSLPSLCNIIKKHWVMTLTTFVYIFFSVMCSVASESMTIRAGNECQGDISSKLCELEWIIEVRVVRGLEAFLAMTAIMIFVRVILSYGRPRGVFSYPCSIASMAALLSNQAIIEDFQQIDPQADDDALAKALAGNQYSLEKYETTTGVVRYGLTKSTTPMPLQRATSSLSAEYSALPNPDAKCTSPPKRWIPWPTIVHILFLAAHLAFFAVILVYQINHKNASIFLNKATFGPRFLLVGVATLLDVQWKRLEREVRIMVPYRRLSKRNASSRELIVMSLHGVPITTFPFALWYGNWFHAFVACVAIISDVLIIAVAGIPYNFGQIRDVSLVSSYASLAMLGIMVVAIVSIFVWRWGNPKVPRKPDTLASVWMMLCASRMLDYFEGMEEVSRKSRDLAIRGNGRRYQFGRATGVDGKERDMVDEDFSEPEES